MKQVVWQIAWGSGLQLLGIAALGIASTLQSGGGAIACGVVGLVLTVVGSLSFLLDSEVPAKAVDQRTDGEVTRTADLTAK
jgi:hypothetical protein